MHAKPKIEALNIDAKAFQFKIVLLHSGRVHLFCWRGDVILGSLSQPCYGVRSTSYNPGDSIAPYNKEMAIARVAMPISL